MAAWHVRPPLLVTMALANFITGSQLGSVISVTKISPALTSPISAELLTNLTGPVPIFCPIALPWASTLPLDFNL